MKNKIYCGKAEEILPSLPSESVHCCITSPPYLWQRDYGVEGQLGQENSPSAYVQALVSVFSEVKRLLRQDGSLWLNLGDKYRDKQLLGLPWRVALAMKKDGWLLRQEIIWHKPDGFPTSAQDRLTTAHEHLFLFTKSQEYYFDKFALEQFERSVWTVPTANYKGAHFATFPAEIVEPAIFCGTSGNGCCPTCAKPQNRKVSRDRKATRPGRVSKVSDHAAPVTGNRDPLRHTTTVTMLGWEPGCTCKKAKPIPCTVLDPFFGAGTVGVVCRRYNRNYIGVEINPKNVAMAEKRIFNSPGPGFGLSGK